MTDRTCRRAAALFLTASTLALASPAMAADVLFSTDPGAGADLDRRVGQAGGLTQIRLDSGAIASFVDAADYRINADGSIDLFAGTVTVAGVPGVVTIVRMPDGVEGRVGGQGSAASFSVAADGGSRGHVMGGNVRIVRDGASRDFALGEMWQRAGHGGLRRVVSNGEQTTPGAGEAQVVDMTDGGPVAAAGNGVPVTLGDALAAAGAAGDVIAAARRVEAAAGNPAIETFPAGDLALLVAHAGRLEGLHGGTPFPGTGADVIRTYLGSLAEGGSGADLLTAYAGFLVQYLDLIRAGALPSSFDAASLADIDAFIAYTGRTSGFAGLGAANRTLVEAYLAFLQGGGDPDLFAGRYTDLVDAYFAYLRTGGDPADFTGATQATVDAYVAFLDASGLIGQLTAANRALLQAYLANGGFAFTGQYQAALDAYFGWLAAGNLPSDYAALDPATLRAYLETLETAGLLDLALGARADFFAGYLAYLRGGGAIDGYPGLNANVFAGYAADLGAFFAYLQSGGQPNGYSGDVEALFAYLAALEEAGALAAYLGDSADFYADYLAFVSGGGDANLFAQLPGLNLDSFAAALNAYALFLEGGGLPSGYSAADLQELAGYIEILHNSGRLAELLGPNASLLDAYFAFLTGGGAPDRFSGLPVYFGDVEALNAYHAFLAGGGLPGDYTALTQAQIRVYLNALNRAGGLTAYGDLQGFFANYYAHLAGGGTADTFVSLPTYQSYLAALQAYYAYLAGGGLPSGYTALTLAQIEAYLALLAQHGVLQVSVSDEIFQFLTDYLAFIQVATNDPDDFDDLPANDPGVSLASGAGVWIFSNQGGRIGIAPSADVTPEGQITRTDYTTGSGTVSFDYTGAGNTLGEYGRVGNNVAWTRYEHGAGFGVTNANSHLLLGSPAIDLPASGLVEYRLVGGTAPTDSFAPAGEIGAFGGSLAVAFGSAPRVGFEFDVHVGTRGWHTQTPGGAAGAATGGLSVGGDMRFESQNLQHSGIAGDACTGYCNVSVYGGLFGGGAANAGFQYHIDDQSGGVPNRSYVNGVAVFGTSGDELALIGTMPGGGGAPPDDDPTPLAGYSGGFNAPTANVNMIVGGQLNGNPFAGGESGFQTSDYALDSNGVLLSYVRGLGGTTRTIGSTSGADVLGNADVLIGRWASGTNTGGNPFTMSADQGLHTMLARPLDPSATLPASGRIDYYLIGATSPTIADGSYAPGSFEADMAILFGSQNRLAMEGAITMPTGGADYVFSFSTAGGIADAAQTTTDIVANGMGFFGASIDATDTAGNCPGAGSCTLSVNASFAGNEDTVGMTYQGYVPVAGKSLVGAAIFASGPARTGGTGTSGNSYAALAAAPVAAASREWGRWTASASLTGVSTPDMPVLQAGGAAALDLTAAEARLAGLVTFARP